MKYRRLSQAIESTSEAIEFLEALGYRGGDIHDNLVEVLNYLKARKESLLHAEAISEAWSKGLSPELNPTFKKSNK